MNLLTGSLVISVRDAFIEHCGRKPDCRDVRSKEDEEIQVRGTIKDIWLGRKKLWYAERDV